VRRPIERIRVPDAHGPPFFREYRTPAFVLTVRRGVPPHLESAGRECKVSRKRAAGLIRPARFLGFKRVIPCS
jgi:hypothetical protein